MNDYLGHSCSMQPMNRRKGPYFWQFLTVFWQYNRMQNRTFIDDQESAPPPRPAQIPPPARIISSISGTPITLIDTDVDRMNPMATQFRDF